MPDIFEGYITTSQAAKIIEITSSQVKYLCKRYQEGDGGLRCTKVGEGKSVRYLIAREDAEAYKAVQHPRGWRRGRKRKAT